MPRPAAGGIDIACTHITDVHIYNCVCGHPWCYILLVDFNPDQLERTNRDQAACLCERCVCSACVDLCEYGYIYICTLYNEHMCFLGMNAQPHYWLEMGSQTCNNLASIRHSASSADLQSEQVRAFFKKK